MTTRPSPPILGGQRVTLSSPTAGDEKELIAFHARNALHFKPWLPRPSGDLASASFWSQWITLSNTLQLHGGVCNLVMRLTGETRIIGQIDYSLIMRGPLNSTMVGFQLDQAHEGRGLMREALALSLSHVFNTLKIHRVVAAYVPENQRSERLLAGLSFAKEGIARDFLEIDGVKRDHVITARLASD
jgi:[ribosomal protein S5]-alanine N-acetyltransferase